MRTLYLDCFAGVSGNMFVGALLDLGVPEEQLRKELAKLPIDGYDLSIKKVTKLGIQATYFNVKLGWFPRKYRYLPDILELINHAPLDEQIKVKSNHVFYRLAEAEAKVHGIAVDKVHFHEIGAIDTIVDIVGTVFGLHFLGIEQIFASKLYTGKGFVKCSHGVMPIPAPATAELLRGIPYEQGEIEREMVTPTGAALVATLCTNTGGMPADFVSEKNGYGAGTWDVKIPNTLRAVLGATNAQGRIEEKCCGTL